MIVVTTMMYHLDRAHKNVLCADGFVVCMAVVACNIICCLLQMDGGVAK
eukprot:COSAG02_NODE_5905_length_3945_cov_7.102127_3_plen_49_part_00